MIPSEHLKHDKKIFSQYIFFRNISFIPVILVLFSSIFLLPVDAVTNQTIHIDPIPDHGINETFTISGTVSDHTIEKVNVTVVQKSYDDAEKILSDDSGEKEKQVSCDKESCMLTTFSSAGMPERITYPQVPDLRVMDVPVVRNSSDLGTWKYTFDKNDNTTVIKPDLYMVVVSAPGSEKVSSLFRLIKGKK